MFGYERLSDLFERFSSLLDIKFTIFWILIFFFYLTILNLFKRKLKNRSIFLFISYCSLFCFFITFATAIYYIVDPTFIDHAESSISTVSWLLYKGKLLYHEINSPSRYSFVYGPYSFIPIAVIFSVLGAKVYAAKIAGFVYLILSFIFSYKVYRSYLEKKEAFVFLGIMAVFLSYFLNMPYWVRPNSALNFLVSLSLYSAICVKSINRAGLIISSCFGIGMGLKFHAFLYFFPVYLILLNRSNLKTFLFFGFLAGPISLFPFLSSKIDLPLYLEWIQMSKKMGLSYDLFKRNIVMWLSLFAPYLIGAFILKSKASIDFIEDFNTRKYRYFFVSVLVCTLIMTIVASKPGAGRHHLMPYSSMLVFFFLGLYKGFKKMELLTRPLFLSSLLSTFSIFILVGLLRQGKVNSILMESNGRSVHKDIEGFIAKNKNQLIMMGPGEKKSYNLTFNRLSLVANNSSYYFDIAAMMDMTFTNFQLPDSSLNLINRCDIKYWMIPKNNEAFEIRNYYNAAIPTFPNNFKKLFLESYRIVEKTKYFDVWKCIH